MKAIEPAIGEARSVEPSRQAIVRHSAQGGRGNLINHEPGGFAMVKTIEYGEFEDAEAELISKLENLRDAYLRSNGWAYVCNTPGGLWLWKKTLSDGCIALVDINSALYMQRNTFPANPIAANPTDGTGGER